MFGTKVLKPQVVYEIDLTSETGFWFVSGIACIQSKIDKWFSSEFFESSSVQSCDERTEASRYSITVQMHYLLMKHVSLGPRPKTNPSADRFPRAILKAICAGVGFGSGTETRNMCEIQRYMPVNDGNLKKKRRPDQAFQPHFLIKSLEKPLF